MKNRIVAFVLGAAVLASTAAIAQKSPLLLPPAIEKELAARASDVSEVTLDKNMLGFAAKVMKDKSDASTRQLIEGLDGIYVRDYEFDKEGQYSMAIVDQLRQAFETPEWSPLVHEHDKKSGEVTYVMMKLVNGQPQGMFILSAEPKELSVVLILGPIRMDQLGALKGLGGLGALGGINGVQQSPRGNGHAKDKGKTGGAQ